jgi:hypothetical protein
MYVLLTTNLHSVSILTQKTASQADAHIAQFQNKILTISNHLAQSVEEMMKWKRVGPQSQGQDDPAEPVYPAAKTYVKEVMIRVRETRERERAKEYIQQLRCYLNLGL